MKTHVSEIRKIRKPLMEKKRRARINDSLETLKQILLDAQPQCGGDAIVQQRKRKSLQARNAKLEKADILEMTVHYIQNLRMRLDGGDARMTLMSNGDLASSVEHRHHESMWRPW